VTSSADETFRRAFASLQAGNAANAERLFRKLLAAQPRHVAGLNLFGILLIELGRLDEAERYVKRALNENPNSDVTLYNYGILLQKLKRPVEAYEQFSRALKINAAVPETWNNRGSVLNDLGRHSEAVADFEKAISLNPKYAEAFFNKAKSLAELGMHERSLAAFDSAIALRSDFADAWLGRANALTRLRRRGEALIACDRAVAIKPDLVEAWLGRGRICCELKQYTDALASYERALALTSGLAEAWLGRGNLFAELKRYDDAFADYDKALALKPELAEAWLGRGNVFAELKRYDDAFAGYDKALTLKPELAEAWLGRANLCTELRRYDDAVAAYDKALALEPDLPYAAGVRFFAKLAICNWTDLESEAAHVLRAVRDRKPASPPFAFLSVSSSPADQLRCARRFADDQLRFQHLWQGEIYSHDRIRVAYLSADFRDHAVAHAIAGIFEQHDRTRFEWTAISFGPPQESEVRRRIENSFEHFIEASGQSDHDIAELVRRREIDIAVDLNGHTFGGRPSIFARRAAPIQVSYLGYSATMGTDYIDYILADSVVIPEIDVPHYSEQVVWLPDSFMPTDSRRCISERTPSRDECGLPEAAFVFCCFNNSYKFTPQVFRIWMRLLKATESVLWLAEPNAAAIANLRREAGKCGVAAERLIFAPRTPDLADHLARYRQADLFLDTLPYNAHSTACDALWAGLPVLTCAGSTFAGRVGASVLNAAGLGELVADSLENYEALALKLAQDRALLASLKGRLARDRETCPLFDTSRLARHIEAAYAAMWERYRKGAPAKGFEVGPIGRPIAGCR
jgi:predicted O-linked N-acetylglucosamine transferase (SPINDLY family)